MLSYSRIKKLNIFVLRKEDITMRLQRQFYLTNDPNEVALLENLENYDGDILSMSDNEDVVPRKLKPVVDDNINIIIHNHLVDFANRQFYIDRESYPSIRDAIADIVDRDNKWDEEFFSDYEKELEEKFQNDWLQLLIEPKGKGAET